MLKELNKLNWRWNKLCLFVAALLVTSLAGAALAADLVVTDNSPAKTDPPAATAGSAAKTAQPAPEKSAEKSADASTDKPAATSNEKQADSSAEKPAAKADEWPLPKVQDIPANMFRVSAGGQCATVTVVGEIRTGPGEDDKLTKQTAWRLDFATGQWTHVGDLLGGEARTGSLALDTAEPSPDGRYLAVEAEGAGDQDGLKVIWLVDLKNSPPRKITQGWKVQTAWLGGKLAVSCFDADKNLLPLKLVDPATGQAEELKVRALVSSADAKGTVMAAVCNALDPAEAVSAAGFSSQDMVLLSPAGKVLRKLGRMTDFSEPPVFSPGGKFLAFQFIGWKGEKTMREPDLVRVDLVSLDGSTKRSLEEKGLPVYVGDDGQVVTLSEEFATGGGTVKLWDAAGKSQVLAEKAWAAAVAGGKLYYVTGEDEKVLKVRPLPK